MKGFNDSNLGYSKTFIAQLQKKDLRIQAVVLRILNNLNEYGLAELEMLIPDSDGCKLTKKTGGWCTLKYTESKLEIILSFQIINEREFYIEQLY